MPGPVVSAIASLVVPGAGQILNGKYKRGGALLLLDVLTMALSSVLIVGLFVLVHLVFMIAAAVDAYRVAKRAAEFA